MTYLRLLLEHGCCVKKKWCKIFSWEVLSLFITTTTMESDAEEELVDFPDITTGTVGTPVVPGFISWCPNMDMVMFTPASPDGGLIVYRLSGQVVWTVTPRKGQQLLPLEAAWSEDGMHIAS